MSRYECGVAIMRTWQAKDNASHASRAARSRLPSAHS
jgi:hypothetical protein